MAFWGVQVKPGKPFTHKTTEATGTRRLHLSQATLGLGNATNTSIVQCNVGNKSPLFLCVLSPGKVDSCQLNLEFEEADEVVFSVIGPRSVHLTGYFIGRSYAFELNDDESESYGEDIVDTDVEKGSSDDYDYSDSFINDDDPSGRGSHVSSTDDDADEISIKKMAAKTTDKKRNGNGGRLRKKFQVSDSDSDETSAKADDSSYGDSVEVLNNDNEHKISNVLSSECPLPSRVTRSKARTSTLENDEPNAKSEKRSEAITNTDKALEKREDKSLGDVELSPVQKVLKKKRKKEQSKSSVVINLDDGEGKNMPEVPQNEKPATDKGIKPSSDPLPSQNGDATLSKKKRKRDRKEETTDVQENLSECPEKKKRAINKNVEKEAGTKKPLGSEISSNEVIIEEIEKGNLDGKSAVKGKKVSIHYTGKLKDTGKVFESSLREAPLKFRLGGEKVIEGLSIGVEGMRVGDKRRLIIPPSLGFSEERLKEGVPKDAWLVYDVERVKTKS